MSRTIASRKELSHAIKRNRPQDSSGIQISKGRGREGSVQHSCGAGCQGGANKGIRKALRTRTSGTGSFTGSTRITGAGWIQCSSRHICAPEICRKPETRATKPPDKQLAQDARSADASKTCIVQEKKEVPRWAEGHGARRN